MHIESWSICCYYHLFPTVHRGFLTWYAFPECSDQEDRSMPKRRPRGMQWKKIRAKFTWITFIPVDSIKILYTFLVKVQHLTMLSKQPPKRVQKCKQNQSTDGINLIKADNNVVNVTYTKMQCTFQGVLLQSLIICNQTQKALITSFSLSIVLQLHWVAVTLKLI